jgi:hypothetical protein
VYRRVRVFVGYRIRLRPPTELSLRPLIEPLMELISLSLRPAIELISLMPSWSRW